MDETKHPYVVVIIPTLNEEAHIGEVLRNLQGQASDSVRQILVADGGSTDRTREIVRQFERADARVRLIHNHQQIQAAGVNAAAAAAAPEAEVFIRVDAHSRYPDDYVASLLNAHAQTKADCVVVRLRTVGRTCFERAVAAASNSVFGAGGSAHRTGRNGSGYVDHGHHALILRSVFDRAGGYDPEFRTNEDAELDARIRKLGGSIWLAADIIVEYFPRGKPSQLARQYFRYGRGRSQMLLKSGEKPALRQIAPVALTLAMTGSLLSMPASALSVAFPLLYFLAVTVASCILAVREKSLCALLCVVVLPTMHLSWGGGFLAHRLQPAPRTKLTRPRSLEI